MHFYWRIIEELKFIGETWTIHHPNLLRCYRNWLKCNANAIALSLSDTDGGPKPVPPAEPTPLFSLN